jgi:hypothetical protein
VVISRRLINYRGKTRALTTMPRSSGLLGCRSTSRLLPVIHIRERVAAAILHDETGVAMVFDGPRRKRRALVTLDQLLGLPAQ